MRQDQASLEQAVSVASAQARYEMDRLQAQLAFAESLCELQPEKAAAWRPLAKQAVDIVGQALAGGTGNLPAAVRKAEEALTPLAQAAKTYTVRCVGHAHIDMNWMWSWPETVAVTTDTFATVLRLMEEFPSFRFSQSQASVYAITEQHNPRMLEWIAARVKEGRWEVTASHWVEGDKNLAGGESLCRHLLYTRRYVQKLFGLSPEEVNIDWSPDTFGHAVTVPTYLARGGIKYLYLHRPGTHGPKRPGAFWWTAPDGSRVLVRNDMGLGYNGRITPAVAQHLVGFAKETGSQDYMFVYGVGDHGGGPTRRDILCALDMATWPIFPNIRLSSARAFYEQLEKRGKALPTLDCELNTEFTGCYTSQSLIKKANRYGEKRLVDAEAAAVIAWAAASGDYPAESLEAAWRDTLFSHFHDILPGSGVHDTRTYTHGLYQKTMATTAMAETNALRLLASRVDTSAAAGHETQDVPPQFLANGLGAGVGYDSANGSMSRAEQSAGQGNRPFIVFNPCAWDRAEIVEATVWDNVPAGFAKPLAARTFSVRLPNRKTIPAQVLDKGGYWGHDFVTLAFPARVKGLGYSQCAITEEASPAAEAGVKQLGNRHHCPYAPNERSPEGLENDLVRLEIDTTTGGIRRLVEKRSNLELISPARPAPALEYGLERPHGMTSWSIEHTGPLESPECVAIRRKSDGPYKAAIEVSLRIRNSDFVVTYELRAGDPKVTLRLRGTWFERGTPNTGVPVLRMAFPLAVANAAPSYEIPFGAVDRALNRGEEVPALSWAKVTGLVGEQPAGCLLLNDSKHGHSLDGNVLRLTLIRSSHDPDPLPEIGQHEILMALVPFSGIMSVAEATRHARDLNHSLRVVGTDVHKGDLPALAQILSVRPENLIVSGIKKAEDGDAVLVRVYETAGRRTTAKLKFNTDLVGEIASAAEVDLMERPAAKPTAKTNGDTVSISVPARGIASVSVKLKR